MSIWTSIWDDEATDRDDELEREPVELDEDDEDDELDLIIARKNGDVILDTLDLDEVLSLDEWLASE